MAHHGPLQRLLGFMRFSTADDHGAGKKIMQRSSLFVCQQDNEFSINPYGIEHLDRSIPPGAQEPRAPYDAVPGAVGVPRSVHQTWQEGAHIAQRPRLPREATPANGALVLSGVRWASRRCERYATPATVFRAFRQSAQRAIRGMQGRRARVAREHRRQRGGTRALPKVEPT